MHKHSYIAPVAKAESKLVAALYTVGTLGFFALIGVMLAWGG